MAFRATPQPCQVDASFPLVECDSSSMGRCRISYWSRQGCFIFEKASEVGLEIEEIWERDINGGEREWVKEPNSRIEDVTERKKWLVVALLRRTRFSSSAAA